MFTIIISIIIIIFMNNIVIIIIIIIIIIMLLRWTDLLGPAIGGQRGGRVPGVRPLYDSY